MSINATVLGQFIIIFALFVGVLSYYLGRRKTQTPVIACLFGIVLSVVPPFGLVYLIVLLLKNDINPTTTTGG
jgi:hypothetical protein